VDLRTRFSEDSAAFIAPWVRQPGTVALACTDPQGTILGHGAIRPCRAGFKFGPLFADDKNIAERLLTGLMTAVPVGSEVFWTRRKPILPSWNWLWRMACHRFLQPRAGTPAVIPPWPCTLSSE
jgi:hypothetical protein